MEEKKESVEKKVSKPEAKYQLKSTQKIKELNQQLNAQLSGSQANSNDDQEPVEGQIAAPVKKVYGVAKKPAPRNAQEKEYVGVEESVDWIPPDSNDNNQNELLKKLGY